MGWGADIQGHSLQCSKLKAHLGYMSLILKKEKKEKKRKKRKKEGRKEEGREIKKSSRTYHVEMLHIPIIFLSYLPPPPL